MRKLYYLPLCTAMLVLAGCNDHGLSADEKEERDPLVKTGAAFMEQSQWDDAERSFKEALEKDPMMAKPHLDLALIYQQYKPNYIHAIYHYDRYLELRPDSEKAGFIKEQRDKVLRALVIQAIQQSPDVQKVVAEVKRLQQENADLKKQLAAASQTSKPATQPTTTTAVETKAPQTASAAPVEQSQQSHQIYTVVAGDTLTKIATKFYGNAENWEPIYQANRDSLSSPSSLRVGQTLVIPALNK